MSHTIRVNVSFAGVWRGPQIIGRLAQKAVLRSVVRRVHVIRRADPWVGLLAFGLFALCLLW
jgi:hypothetical protein